MADAGPPDADALAEQGAALADAAVVVQSPGMIGADVDGEIVLIGVETGRYHGLDPVGSAIWRALETPIRVDALCAQMVAHFDGDAATITHETRTFLARLVSRGLATAAH